MSHHNGEEHPEDNSVNVKIALFFIAVLAAITLIGIIN